MKKWTIQFYNELGEREEDLSAEYIVKGEKFGTFINHIECDGWFIANYTDVEHWKIHRNPHTILAVMFNDDDLDKTWEGMNILDVEDCYDDWDTDYDYLDELDDMEQT